MYDYCKFFGEFFGFGWIFYEIIYFVFIVFIMVVFGLVVGNFFEEMFVVFYVVGVVGLLIVVVFLVFLGISVIENVFVFWLIVFYGVYFVFFVWVILSFGDEILVVFLNGDVKEGWFGVGVCYVVGIVGVLLVMFFVMWYIEMCC